MYKVLDAYAVGKFLPIGPWGSTALIANALASVTKNGLSKLVYIGTGVVVSELSSSKNIWYMKDNLSRRAIVFSMN